MSHIFVPILKNMFNHWFVQEPIHSRITKEVITLQKKEACLGKIDDLRPITPLNTVKDFGPVLGEPFAYCCQGLDQT